MSLHPIFARMHSDMAALGLLPEPELDSLPTEGIPVPKSPHDSEQHAPLTTPTQAEVDAMRAGIEAHKRRNAEATPPRAWHAEPHGEL